MNKLNMVLAILATNNYSYYISPEKKKEGKYGILRDNTQKKGIRVENALYKNLRDIIESFENTSITLL